MIIDRMAHAGCYRGISPWLDRAIDCMLGTDFDALPAGRYAVDRDDVYYMVQEPALRPEAETKWEIHRRYIDIQIGLADGEAIGYAPADSVDGWMAYDAEKDAAISRAPGTGDTLALRRGVFMILFPQDAHRPCLRAGQAPTGRKVVFKVRV